MQVSLIQSNYIFTLIFIIILYLIYFVFSKFLLKFNWIRNNLSISTGRYENIDGLRGILATGVMMHHCFVAYGFFSTGIWKNTNNPIIDQLGQTSVALFFMITGYIFANKSLLNKINWYKYFESRFRRLFPLYFLVILAVFIIAFFHSQWKLNVSYFEICSELFKWMTFCIFGRPEINMFENSEHILAGVNWTLKYEILFYTIAVPGIHFLYKKNSIPKIFLIATILYTIMCIYYFKTGCHSANSIYCLHFLSGIILALATKIKRFITIIHSVYIRIFGIISFIVLLFTMDSSNVHSAMFTLILFTSIIGGGSLFNFLKSEPVVWLGDISYGIYLTHGIVLWIGIQILSKYFVLSEINILIFLCLCILCIFMISILASLSYVFVERKFMKSSKR